MPSYRITGYMLVDIPRRGHIWEAADGRKRAVGLPCELPGLYIPSKVHFSLDGKSALSILISFMRDLPIIITKHFLDCIFVDLC